MSIEKTIQPPERPGTSALSPFCNATCCCAAEDKASEPSFSAAAPPPACFGRDVPQLCLDAGMPLKSKSTDTQWAGDTSVFVTALSDEMLSSATSMAVSTVGTSQP